MKNILSQENIRNNKKLILGVLAVVLMVIGLLFWWRSTFRESTDDAQVDGDTGLIIHASELATGTLLAGNQVRFTIYWPEAGHWEEVDFTVLVIPGDSMDGF